MPYTGHRGGFGRNQAEMSGDPRKSLLPAKNPPAGGTGALLAVRSIAAFLIALLPAQAGQSERREQTSPYSGAESALGAQLAQQAERTEKLLEDPEAAAYVRDLAGKLARHAGLRVSARVLDSSDLFSLALPGGYIYISTGLIVQTAAEAELAAVLAHLIAHLAEGHRMHSIARGQNVSQYDLVRVDFFGTSRSSCLRLMRENEVPAGWIVRYGSAERKADTVAAGYLHAAGFDPVSLPEVFNKMRYEQPRMAGRMSSEELIATRTYIEETFAPAPAYVANSETFARIRGRLVEALKRKMPPPPLERIGNKR